MTGAVGAVIAFAATVAGFSVIESGGRAAKLIGADNELGFPSPALAIALFAIVLAVGVAQLAGAVFPVGWWSALTPILLIGVLFELWSLYLNFTAFALVLLVVMALALAQSITQTDWKRRNSILGSLLVVAAVVGFFAAFRLTVDKVGTYITPSAPTSCNYSVLVQCGVNLKSRQGSIFGFPNPLIGIGGWIAVLMVGIMLLVGLRFARWFWIALNAGVALALVLVIWLISQSIFQLHTLCPWCMTTWAVVIPTFWLVTFRNIAQGAIPATAPVRRVFTTLYGLVPLVTLLSYVVVAVIAQIGLDLLSYL